MTEQPGDAERGAPRVPVGEMCCVAPWWSEPFWRWTWARCRTRNKWIGPSRLTPQVFLDGFATVFGRHPGFRKNHAKDVAVSGYFDSIANGRTLSKGRCSDPAAPR